MAIKFDKIKAGMTLLDVHRERMGNTTIRQWGSWRVRVLSVDTVKQTAEVSWNGNRPETWYRHQLERLYTKEPKCLRDQEEQRARRGGRFW